MVTEMLGYMRDLIPRDLAEDDTKEFLYVKESRYRSILLFFIYQILSYD